MVWDEITELAHSTLVLRSPCDLDLLIFFARHPCAMLTSEMLATFLGYELGEIADSLEVLLGAGLVTRHQTPAHAARMYLFAGPASPEDWPSRVVRLASTRQGLLQLRAALARRPAPPTERPGLPREPANGPGPRRLDPSPGTDVERPGARRTRAV